MPIEYQIIEAPIGRESEDEVRAALEAQFAGFTVGKVAKNTAEGVWNIRLFRQAEFPLKGLGPEGEEAPPPDEGPAEEPGDPKLKAKDKKPPSDDKALDDDPDSDSLDGDVDAPPFGGDGDDEPGGDPITRIESLLHDLKKVIPQLQALLRGDGIPGGDMPPPHGDDLGLGGPPGDGLGPPGGGGPPPGGGLGRPPGPPHVPPGAGGNGPPGMGGPPGGRRPGTGVGGPPRGQMPTFTHRSTVRLEREASISPAQARKELLEDYPEYKIDEFSRNGEKFVVKLVRR